MKANDGTISWREVVTQLTATFTAAEVDTPTISAERIAEQASGLSPAELQLAANTPVTNRQIAAVDAMAARRSTGEPLQYVVGSWGFRNLDVMVDRRVLIPRPETEEIAGWALDEVDRIATKSQGPVAVVDLGTGSGVIGLSIAAERTNAVVTLTDVDADALAVARANTAGLGGAARRVTIAQGDWFEALNKSLLGQIGVIVSNPPYVAPNETLPSAVTDWEPETALRAADDGRAHIGHLIENADAWLAPHGALIIEMSPTQISWATNRATVHFANIEIHDDLARRQRAICARHPLKNRTTQ